MHRLPYNQEKRILVDLPGGNTADITVHILNVAIRWFVENNYHISKFTTDDQVMALAFIEDTEPLTVVEDYYNIEKEDYRPTATKMERNNGLYKIREE
ncbi:hypothetical protein QQY92_00570 [Streptococcus suis]|uniref:hypothetical protein n=1 Tax=Streptococcus suis TaxID=1307 RepID=UPI001DA11F61|nr:hypothetical protein [Streptococcus suis]MBS8094468.1 hypothetical protein [Streptococcus suis]MDG3268785.1 hypothetical protein [Streptococcus suis]